MKSYFADHRLEEEEKENPTKKRNRKKNQDREAVKQQDIRQADFGNIEKLGFMNQERVLNEELFARDVE